MAKVLVTGATGFIGSHLIRALCAQGDEVTCLARKTSNLDGPESLGAEVVYGDVTDAESLAAAISGKSVVYHLAAIGSTLRLKYLYEVNEQGAGCVAEQCARQTTPPVLVSVSSLAAVGPSAQGEARVESDPARPVSHYGRSKRLGEEAVELFADRVPISIVRPSIVFGEGDRYCLPMFRMVHRYGVHVAPSYSVRRFSVIHADDLASLLMLVAEKGERLSADPPSNGDGRPQGYYFAAAEECPTYHEFGCMVGEALERPRTRVISFGPMVVWSVAAVCEAAGRLRGQPPVFSIDKAREARAGHWVCSARKAVDQVGFGFSRPLGDRLRQTARWYLDEAWL